MYSVFYFIFDDVVVVVFLDHLSSRSYDMISEKVLSMLCHLSHRGSGDSDVPNA